MTPQITSFLLALILLVTGCSAPAGERAPVPSAPAAPQEVEPMPRDDPADPATLLYQGQASIRIVTGEGKVIYIDPYAGDGYDLPADLILVTHGHYDHNGVEKVANRAPDCQIITQREALKDGRHQTFDLDFVTVEAVEAGYNRWHDADECVGYVLTFSNGASVYVTGDTSTTEQMPGLAEKEIDYALFCCDGVYNMGLEEAAECARLVGAKHNIPYHVTASNGSVFDRERAEQLDVENRLILAPGEELPLEKEDDAMNRYDFSIFSNVEITGVDLSALSEEQLGVLYCQTQYCQAMTEADTAALRELVAEDTVFTHMSGRQQTREEYFADIENGSLRYFAIEIENPAVTVDGDTASIAYTSVLNANAYGAVGIFRMRGTHWFVRRDGEWIAVNRPDQ